MKTIRLQEAPFNAVVEVPGSKSISNRALILAALAKGRTRLINLQFSDDSRRMLECLKALGYEIHWDEEDKRAEITGQEGRVPNDSPAAKGEADLFVGNAGTAARFLPCLAALGSQRVHFSGDERMSARPMGALLDVLKEQGAGIDSDRYPFNLEGRGLKGGHVSIDINASTQFASGLLMAAPYAKKPLALTLAGERSNIPFIEMSAAMMRSFGVDVARQDNAWVPPLQGYLSPGDYVIEPDISGASYFFAAAALVGGRVTVETAKAQSLQGDIRFLKVLQHMGCEFFEDPNGLTVEKEPGRILKGVELDMNAFADQALTVAALAPFCDRPTVIRNVAHIRKQECDRIHAISKNLKTLGVEVEEFPDGVKITPGPVQGGTIETFGDHRVAMAFSLVGLKVPGVVIDNEACVAKTFEDYWNQFERLQSSYA